MENIFIYIGLIYIILCVMIGIEGSKRHVGFPLAFIISLGLTPIIGVLVVSLSNRL